MASIEECLTEACEKVTAKAGQAEQSAVDAATSATSANSDALRAEQASSTTNLSGSNLFEKDYEVVSQMPSTPTARAQGSGSDNAYGCGVGTRDDFNAIAVYLKARDTKPTTVKVRIKENGYDGTLLAEAETMYFDDEVNIIPLQTVISSTSALWVEIVGDGDIGFVSDPHDTTYEASQGKTRSGRTTPPDLTTVPSTEYTNDAIWMKFVDYEGKDKVSEEGVQVFREDIAEIPELNVPATIYGTVGYPLQLFKRGLIKDYQTDRLSFNTNVLGETSKNFKRYIEINEVAEITREATIWLEDIKQTVVTTASTSIIFRNAVTNPASVKNVLVVGDSITDNGYVASRLKERLNGDNFNFIGTRSAPDGTPDEGYSGSRYRDFVEGNEVQGNQTPFYSSGSFSFADYMADNGYVGDIDYLICHLGWNDQSNGVDWETKLIPYAKTFYDKLIADYPNCKIIIMGMSSACSANGAYAYGDNLSRGNWYKAMQSIWGLNESLQKMITDNSYTNATFVDQTFRFDSDYGFDLIDKDVSINAVGITEKVSPKFIHPNLIGEYCIADAIYDYFPRD